MSEQPNGYTIDRATTKANGSIEGFSYKYDNVFSGVMRPITQFRGEPIQTGYYVVADSTAPDRCIYSERHNDFLHAQKRGGHYSVRISFMQDGHPIQRGYMPIGELVLAAFTEPPTDDCFSETTHLDGDPTNNSMGNLAYSIPKKLRSKPEREAAPLPFRIDERPAKHGRGSPYGIGCAYTFVPGEVLGKPITFCRNADIRSGYFILSEPVMAPGGYESQVYSTISNQFLRQYPDANGRLQVKLRLADGKKRRNFSVHQLVVSEWIADKTMRAIWRMEEIQINHRDGNFQNNRVPNLEISTRDTNGKHRHEVLTPMKKQRKLEEHLSNNTRED